MWTRYKLLGKLGDREIGILFASANVCFYAVYCNAASLRPRSSAINSFQAVRTLAANPCSGQQVSSHQWRPEASAYARNIKIFNTSQNRFKTILYKNNQFKLPDRQMSYLNFPVHVATFCLVPLIVTNLTFCHPTLTHILYNAP